MKEFDLVVFGATGFTGQQAAAYIAETTEADPAASGLRWAIAGRNAEKLESVRASLGAAFAELPLIVADALDPDAMRAMAERTRVVLTTAGPYALYGDHLVRACVENGCDYVDITGETPWVRKLIDHHHQRAQRKGARIINFCGVDSIPSDLGTLFLVRETQRRLGESLKQVLGLFSAKAGLNGGTAASFFNMIEQGQVDEIRKPYLLNPAEDQMRSAPADRLWPQWDRDWWVWTAPFVMAPVNTRVVRRSEALYRQSGEAYGPNFSYDEALWFNDFLPAKALMISGASLALSELAKFPPVLKQMKKFAPDPGEGPSEELMNSGFMAAWFRGKTESGQEVKARFFCKGDPGNRVTVKLLCESALMLALEDQLPDTFSGGILTPATALGPHLITRLQAAGVTFEWRGAA